jgi:hypothetical protein
MRSIVEFGCFRLVRPSQEKQPWSDAYAADLANPRFSMTKQAI